MDEELVEGARRGDRVAFESLVVRHARAAARTARALLSDQGQAEEAVQEAWLDAWRAIARFTPGRPFRPWLLAVVANRCRMTLRRSTPVVVRLQEIDLEMLGVIDKSPSDPLDGDLARALQELAPDHQRVLALRYFADLDLAEIALVLDVPLGTVKSRLHRAHRLLRERLDANAFAGCRPLPATPAGRPMADHDTATDELPDDLERRLRAHFERAHQSDTEPSAMAAVVGARISTEVLWDQIDAGPGGPERTPARSGLPRLPSPARPSRGDWTQRLGPLALAIVASAVSLFLPHALRMSTNPLTLSATRPAQGVESMADVVVARRNMPAGTRLDPSLLEARQVPLQGVQPDAASSLAEIDGKLLTTSVVSGEQIVNRRLESRLSPGPRPVGNQPISVTLSEPVGSPRPIAPGDLVDVVGVFSADSPGAGQSMLVAHDVEVLAVEPSGDTAPSMAPKHTRTLTLAVPSRAADRLAHAASSELHYLVRPLGAPPLAADDASR